jgi:hypothetical protein
MEKLETPREGHEMATECLRTPRLSSTEFRTGRPSVALGLSLRSHFGSSSARAPTKVFPDSAITSSTASYDQLIFHEALLSVACASRPERIGGTWSATVLVPTAGGALYLVWW